MSNEHPQHDNEFLELQKASKCPFSPCETMKFWRIVWGGFMGGAVVVALAYAGFIGSRIESYNQHIKDTEQTYKEQMSKIDNDNRSISESIARMEERLTTNLQYLREDIKELQTKISK